MIPNEKDHKENELPTSKWSQTRGPKQVNIPLDKIGQYAAKAAFIVHEDQGPQPSSVVTPHKVTPGTSNVLSTRKAEREESMLHCPVALFEPPDPTKRPMYCKEKVYQGATEFSFEELRAVKWRAREKERQERERIEREKNELELRKAELLDKERQLREQQELIARQMEEFRRMMAAAGTVGGGGAVQPASEPPKLTVTRPSCSDASDAASSLSGSVDVGRQRVEAVNHSADSYSTGCPPTSRDGTGSFLKFISMDDTSGLIAANPSGAKTRSAVAATPSPHGNKVQYR
jgi:hypothetical protein